MLESLLFTLGLGVVVTVGPEPEPELESSEKREIKSPQTKLRIGHSKCLKMTVTRKYLWILTISAVVGNHCKIYLSFCTNAFEIFFKIHFSAKLLCKKT